MLVEARAFVSFTPRRTTNPQANPGKPSVMSNAKYAVTAIGNAIVDVLANAEDMFLLQQKLTKGAMTLIDAAGADRLYKLMKSGVEASGGSAANTVAGLAALGGKAAICGPAGSRGAVTGMLLGRTGVPAAARSSGAPGARTLCAPTGASVWKTGGGEDAGIG